MFLLLIQTNFMAQLKVTSKKDQPVTNRVTENIPVLYRKQE